MKRSPKSPTIRVNLYLQSSRRDTCPLIFCAELPLAVISMDTGSNWTRKRRDSQRSVQVLRSTKCWLRLNDGNLVLQVSNGLGLSFFLVTPRLTVESAGRSHAVPGSLFTRAYSLDILDPVFRDVLSFKQPPETNEPMVTTGFCLSRQLGHSLPKG
jgi:hypothetical protein